MCQIASKLCLYFSYIVHWCEKGWLSSLDETNCLQFFPDKGSFQTARQRCRDMGSQIVQPKTAIITELVANLLRADERGLPNLFKYYTSYLKI